MATKARWAEIAQKINLLNLKKLYQKFTNYLKL